MSYQPTLTLNFVYNKQEGDIYVKTKVTVNLDSSEETLDAQQTNVNSAVISKDYRAVPSDEQVPNVFQDEFLVKMIENATTPPGESDITYARERIRQDLQDKDASVYTVNVKVYKQDGQEGGNKSNTLSDNAEIEII